MSEKELEKLAEFTAKCYVPWWVPFALRRRLAEDMAIDIAGIAQMYASGEPLRFTVPG